MGAFNCLTLTVTVCTFINRQEEGATDCLYLKLPDVLLVMVSISDVFLREY